MFHLAVHGALRVGLLWAVVQALGAIGLSSRLEGYWPTIAAAVVLFAGAGLVRFLRLVAMALLMRSRRSQLSWSVAELPLTAPALGGGVLLLPGVELAAGLGVQLLAVGVLGQGDHVDPARAQRPVPAAGEHVRDQRAEAVARRAAQRLDSGPAAARRAAVPPSAGPPGHGARLARGAGTAGEAGPATGAGRDDTAPADDGDAPEGSRLDDVGALPLIRARMAVPAQAITAISPSTVVRVTSSPINSAAQRMLITSCTWLTCAIRPIASPRYQAMPKTTAITQPHHPWPSARPTHLISRRVHKPALSRGLASPCEFDVPPED